MQEGMLLELMQDDRFLLQADRCWTVLFDEMNYLSVIAPPLLYTSVADLLSIDAYVFKSHVLEVGLTSIGYLYLDLWTHLAEASMKYAMGDVRENVERLKLAYLPSEDVSAKMQAFVIMGYEDDVVAALLLLREVSMTSIMVAQAHAIAAQVIHRHQQLGDASLADRMTVHNGRTLFYASSHETAQLNLTQRLEEVGKHMRNTIYVGPR